MGEPSPLLCWAFAACCALNVLTKGLIGIVFPILIVLTHLALTRRNPQAILTRIKQLAPISSTIVFFAIAAPWHILVALANPTQGHPGNLTFTHGHWSVPQPSDGNVHGWLWFYFINEHLLRYLNLRVPRDYDTVPLYLFWSLLLLWLIENIDIPFRRICARNVEPNVLIRSWSVIMSSKGQKRLTSYDFPDQFSKFPRSPSPSIRSA